MPVRVSEVLIHIPLVRLRQIVTALSFFRIELGSDSYTPFVGLRNYVVRLPADAEFLGTLPLTLAFAGVTTAIALPIALGAAILINGRRVPVNVNNDHLTGTIATTQPLRLGKRSTDLALHGERDDEVIVRLLLDRRGARDLRLADGAEPIRKLLPPVPARDLVVVGGGVHQRYYVHRLRRRHLPRDRERDALRQSPGGSVDSRGRLGRRP